jgi:hypothetical protein
MVVEHFHKYPDTWTPIEGDGSAMAMPSESRACPCGMVQIRPIEDRCPQCDEPVRIHWSFPLTDEEKATWEGSKDVCTLSRSEVLARIDQEKAKKAEAERDDVGINESEPELRQMRCPYCKHIKESDPTNSTFEAHPHMEYDSFWCGCAAGSGT